MVPINPSIPARQPQPLRRNKKAKLDRCWARNQGRTARRSTRCSVAQEHLVSQSEQRRRCEKSSVQEARCPCMIIHGVHWSTIIHVHYMLLEFGEETKAPSTSTRTRGRRSAVEKLASPQQTSSKLHVEVWEGLLSNQGMKFSP